MVDLTDERYEAAKQRGEEHMRGPRAVAARYDAGRGRVVITLTSGVELGLAPRDVEGLAGASADDLRVVEIDALGLGVHFPRLDADLYVPALLDGVLGSRLWMAARLGATESVAGSGDGRRRGRIRRTVAGE